MKVTEMVYKSLFFGLIFTISLFSRENPFLAQKEAKDIPISNNYIQSPEHFKKINFKLPDSARVLDYIEIVYQNIDGSISRKKVEIDKQFDWNKKLAFSYDFVKPVEGKSSKRVVTKTIKRRVSKVVNNKVVYEKKTVVKKKLSEKEIKDEVAVTHYVKSDEKDKLNQLKADESALGSLNAKNSSFNSSRDKAKENVVSSSTSSIYGNSSSWNNSKTTGDLESTVNTNQVTVSLGKPRFSQFEFDVEKHKIKITTTDKKNRHFMLVRPNRIIMDFTREVTFPHQTFEINQGIFGEMKVSKKGSNSYRVSIFLEKDYRYKLIRTESGYNVKCYKQE